MNRRDFLKTLMAGGAALSVDATLVHTALAQAPPGSFSPTTKDPTAHVLARLTFGATPDLYEHVMRIGVEAFIEEQLNPDTIDDSATDEELRAYPLLRSEPHELFERYTGRRGAVIRDLIGGTLTRALYSQRALYEIMVHFWTDHFNIYINKGPMFLVKIADDRDVIRAHAMGNFRELLGASNHSSAMLFYLDNAQSTFVEPNENYARELLELHTLGVNGGYTEADVKEVAKLFTGWSIVVPEDGRDNVGDFLFRPFAHDYTDKIVLGQTIAGSGREEGEQLLDMLASHSSTAQHIATKLVRRFVADDPPAALVQQVSQTFLDTNGDIRSMLRTIFTSDEFWQAPPKFKRPQEYVIGMLRALDFQIRNKRAFDRSLGELLQSMGHLPFNWPAPNGFPDVGAYWMQNLLPRWNLALEAAYPRREAQANYDRLTELANSSPYEGIDFLAHYLFGRELTQQERTIVIEYNQNVNGNERDKILATLALFLAAPAYQYR